MEGGEEDGSGRGRKGKGAKRGNGWRDHSKLGATLLNVGW